MMKNCRPNDRLFRFVEYLRNIDRGEGSDLTVLDLRLECRVQRLAEYSEWSASELDLIEREAARYGNGANLTHVLSGTVEPSSVDEDYSWLHSPSPFAWT